MRNQKDRVGRAKENKSKEPQEETLKKNPLLLSPISQTFSISFDERERVDPGGGSLISDALASWRKVTA